MLFTRGIHKLVTASITLPFHLDRSNYDTLKLYEDMKRKNDFYLSTYITSTTTSNQQESITNNMLSMMVGRYGLNANKYAKDLSYVMSKSSSTSENANASLLKL